MEAVKNPEEQEALDGSPSVVTKTLVDLDTEGELHNPGTEHNMVRSDPVIHIQFQCGPVEMVGRNGCTVQNLIDIIVARLEGFQKGAMACDENEQAIIALGDAKEALEQRSLRIKEEKEESKEESGKKGKKKKNDD